MGNRQLGGIAIKAGATLTGLGTLATLAIFVARATDNSSITNDNRGYGPFPASLSPAPSTTPDGLVAPTTAPAASPTPVTTVPGPAASIAATPTPAAGVVHARVALAVLTPSARPVAAGSLPPPAAASLPPAPTTNGPAPQTTAVPAAPPWTLSPMPSPMPPALPPLRLHGPDHVHPAITRHGDPPRVTPGHDPKVPRAHGHKANDPNGTEPQDWQVAGGQDPGQG